jgi:hypothetical protein
MRTKLWVGVGATLVICAAAAATPRPGTVYSRLERVLSALRHAEPRASAASVAETFKEVGITNASGKVVVALGSDDVGDGVVGVLDRNEVPRVAAIVDDDGSGVLVAFNTAGKGGHVLHGTRGLFSQAGDIAEVFPSAQAAVAAGSVMVLDADRAGALRLASQPYDRKVAGIVSGAKHYRPGVTLRALAGIDQGVTLTLSGTVYCLATNANGPIRVGDMLTTSAEPGHAMRVSDREAARGAVIGKAMEGLAGERGLVLVLAGLQ